MLRRISGVSLLLASILLLGGCKAPSGLTSSHAADARGTAWLMPTLTSPLGVQAIVTPYEAKDIHRVEIIPYQVDDQFQRHPLSKATGQPTTSDDPEILTVEMSGEALDLRRAIALKGLRQGTRYWVVANAYSRSGELISSPDASITFIQVDSDDRPRVPDRMPIVLKPVPFLGSLPLDVALSDPGEQLDHLIVTVFKVFGENRYPQGMPAEIRRQDLPRVVTLHNLSAESTYQVELKARPANPESPDLAVETVTWIMENDDAPATRSVTVTVP